MKPKALCYLRVSHKDMNIESQRVELTNYCRSNNLDPVFYEEAHTGTTMMRPVFDKLLEDVRSGVAKTVVVTEDGSKKLVNTNELINEMNNHLSRSAKKLAAKRRDAGKGNVRDVFGDFFGLGANPPGCMAKDGPQVNFR